MKYLLVPLLIIGMFVSFSAALVAMLFFTKTVQTPQELLDILMGQRDSTKVFDEFRLREDRLGELYELAEEYRKTYEQQSQQAQALQDSLAIERTLLQARTDSLLGEQKRLGLIADSTAQVQQEANLKELSKFYDKVKPQLAAEILQQETELSDSTVAKLMKRLNAGQMAKIMGNMNPEYAARITKIMQGMSR